MRNRSWKRAIISIEPIDELNAAPQDDAPPLPEQDVFYKMPAKFGHVPVAEKPLGWDSKRRFEHLHPRVALPFQVVDRVGFGSPELEPNKLFFGDNLHIMRSLPSESIDLIYIDPPFFSQKTYNVLFGDQNELRSFRDIWEGGLNGYLLWLNARLYEMKRLLKLTGAICVHLDWHAAHYVKVEMDKIFGYDLFCNEIVWHYESGGRSSKRFSRKHDVILWYSKTDDYLFDPKAVGVPRNHCELCGSVLEKWNNLKRHVDEDGRVYRTIKSAGKVYKYYDDDPVAPSDVWLGINHLQQKDPERIGYPTQKPERLLDRIIEATTKPDDVVADFFCGGGTTLAAAEELRRRWIGCDISRVAVSITADRVAKVAEERARDAKEEGVHMAPPDFVVAHWGIYEIDNLSKMSQDEFREFVLATYEARPESTGSVIHGYKGKEPIYVGSPDPDVAVRREQVAEFANAVLKRLGSGGVGTMIAWAFTQAARRTAERIAAQEKVSLQFVKLRLIPLESPEFAAHVTSKHERYSELVTFVLPPTIRLKWQRVATCKYRFDVSESIALNSGAKIINAQWDFDYRDHFTSTPGFELQRGKKGEPVLTAEYRFPGVGQHDIAVRVQDDLGGEAILRETVSVS